jgi:hypothetical protein
MEAMPRSIADQMVARASARSRSATRAPYSTKFVTVSAIMVTAWPPRRDGSHATMLPGNDQAAVMAE